MTDNHSSIDGLKRLFADGFTARDIAQPLVSFDFDASATIARQVMEARDFDVVAIRRAGIVAGYVERTSLADGTCGESMRAIEPADLISDAASLSDVILKLNEAPRLFVQLLGAPGAIITRSDLEKPPVRMWLFGIVTLLEMRMSRLIAACCPSESWKQFLSEGRLEKASQLLEERRRRSQNLELIDCLQFADKAQVVARNESVRRLTRFQSRRQVEEVCRALENLRNNLAHAQDIIATDWPTIVLIATDIDGVLRGTREVQAALAGHLPDNGEAPAG